MKKFILNILFTVYALIAVFTTVCLLSYNEYKISEFGDNSIILVTNDELSPDFNKGDLVIVKAGNKSTPKELIDIASKVFSDDKIRYCPHGRPVCIEISKYEIEKQFGRA